MANRYVDSAAGGTNDGTSWTNAFTTLAGAAGVDTAGDKIWVKSTHNESTAAPVSMAWAGTTADPTRIICVSDSGEPPTTVATGAVVATTGASDLTPASAGTVHVHGIRFVAGDSTNAADITFTNGTGRCVYTSCGFELGGNNTGSDWNLGTSSDVTFENCTFKTANAGSVFGTSIARTVMRNCSWESGTAASTPIIANGSSTITLLEGCDFSNLGTGVNIFTAALSSSQGIARNCKMPASWNGSVATGTLAYGTRHEMYNCAAGDTQYAMEVKTEFGTITQDTTIYRNSGASNGITTGISWKMVSGANAEWLHQTLDSPEIVIWNTAVGSAKTVTVEFIIDSAVTLYKEDVWMEVQHLGTSGFPLSVFDNDSRLATYLTAQATTVCDSGTGLANWTGDGGTGNSYKLVSTITPQEVGFIHVVVKLAKASTTIYVDPKITIA